VADEAAAMTTMPYRAPEVFDPERDTVIDCRTDVWGIGCLLFAWWHGYSPFECSFNTSDRVIVTECSHSSVLGKIPKKSRPSDDDMIINDFVSSILVLDHRKRPYTSDIISKAHDILANVKSREGNSFSAA
jgi:serine/threonine kinase 16